MAAIVLTNTPRKGTEFKYGLTLKEKEIPVHISNDQSLVKIQGAAFNHRDVWILKGMYPGIKVDSVLGSDAVAVVTKSSTLQPGQRVLINPGSGWEADKRGPEGEYRFLGLLPLIGTLAETAVVETKELVSCPEHLSVAEAAALPLAGLTAYRALFTKANVISGEHVLITGIGGGVALFALQFAIAAGAHVYVSSSKAEKIEQAVSLGAKGGFNYRDANGLDALKQLLGPNKLSAIIDGAGGPLYANYPKVMRDGGVIVNYGQTSSPQGTTYSMRHVMKNIDVCGSTGGSRSEFKEMVAFVDTHKIRPIVSRVWQGLTMENVESAIDVMSNSEQFGKLVIEMAGDSKL